MISLSFAAFFDAYGYTVREELVLRSWKKSAMSIIENKYMNQGTWPSPRKDYVHVAVRPLLI